MADTATWPVPKFHFEVELGGKGKVSFTEVSGLDMETQLIEYRAGDDKTFQMLKIPGLKKTSNITLKRGVFVGENPLWAWWEDVQANKGRRENITITLLDEEHNPVTVWTVVNAWPVKFTGSDLKSDGNEIAIESIELAHEGLKQANA